MIGQNYITDDGKTRIYFRLQPERLCPYLGIAVDGTATVDWGDNSSSTVTGDNTTTCVFTQHQYARAGEYMISISVSGNMCITSLEGTGYTAASYSGLLTNRAVRTLENICYISAIYKIELGSNCTLDNSSLNGCYGLRSISLPTGSVLNTANMFRECRSLTGVVLPDGVTKVGDYMCYTDPSLRNVALPGSITSIGTSAFSSCYPLSGLSIPKNVDTIGSSAFSSSYALKRLDLPDELTSINSSMFSWCQALMTFTVKDAVTSLGGYTGGAFKNCVSLKEIHFKPTTPPAVGSTGTFDGIAADCIIYVPSGCLSAYTSATNYPNSSTYTYVEE